MDYNKKSAKGEYIIEKKYVGNATIYELLAEYILEQQKNSQNLLK